MSNPSISVVMPAYNHEQFVGEAIDSVLNQSFEDLELIIIDDGSTDQTAEIIQSYQDLRIKYHYQSNQDAYNALNNGMAKTTGKFISIINSDDVYSSNRLERMMQFQAETAAQCLFSDVVLVDDKSNSITDSQFWWIKWHENNRKYYYDYNDLYAAFLHANVMVTTSNLFMTKQAYEQVGNFEPLRYLHDYDYIFRLLNAFPEDVHYLHDEKLMHYRLHGSNTLSEAAIIGREQDRMIIRKNLFNKIPNDCHDYLNIGLDRLIALEHELVEAKAELEKSKKSQAEEQKRQAATKGGLRQLIGKLTR